MSVSEFNMQKIEGRKVEVILDQKTLELEKEYKKKFKKTRFRAEMMRSAYYSQLIWELQDDE